MKVLKSPPKFNPVIRDCGKCGAQLEIEEPDLKASYIPPDPRGDAGYYIVFATCPCCQNTLRVTGVPGHVACALPQVSRVP